MLLTTKVGATITIVSGTLRHEQENVMRNKGENMSDRQGPDTVVLGPDTTCTNPSHDDNHVHP